MDGIIIKDSSSERQNKLLQLIRESDKNHNLLLISVGGVRTGDDAIERIKSGADLLQIYTPLFIQGPYVVNDILRRMQKLMDK